MSERYPKSKIKSSFNLKLFSFNPVSTNLYPLLLSCEFLNPRIVFSKFFLGCLFDGQTKYLNFFSRKRERFDLTQGLNCFKDLIL